MVQRRNTEALFEKRFLMYIWHMKEFVLRFGLGGLYCILGAFNDALERLVSFLYQRVG